MFISHLSLALILTKENAYLKSATNLCIVGLRSKLGDKTNEQNK